MHRILTKERGIDVHVGCEVTAVEGGKVKCKDGRSFDADECIWCTQAGAQEWLRDTGLELSKGGGGGFVCVGDTMESVNAPGVFACGDIR